MSKISSELLDKVVAYRALGDTDITYGGAINIEGNSVRVLEYSPIKDTSDAIAQIKLRLGEEDSVIQSMQQKLVKLRAQYDHPDADKKSAVLEKTLLDWAKKRLSGITQEEFASLHESDNVSEPARLVCSAVTALVRGLTSAIPWSTVQRTLSSSNLISQIMKLDEHPIKEELYSSILDRYFGNRLFTYAFAAQESSTTAIIHKWITAFMDYQRARFIGNNNGELKQLIDACENGVSKAKSRRDSLQDDLDEVSKGNLFCRTGRPRIVPAEWIQFTAKDTRFWRNLFILRPLPRETNYTHSRQGNGRAAGLPPRTANPPHQAPVRAPLSAARVVSSTSSTAPKPTVAAARYNAPASVAPTDASLASAVPMQVASADATSSSVASSSGSTDSKYSRLHKKGPVALSKPPYAEKEVMKVVAAETTINEHVDASLRTLKVAFLGADGAVGEMLQNYELLQNEHNALLSQAQALLQYTTQLEDEVSALKSQNSLRRMEVLLCKAVIAVLRCQPQGFPSVAAMEAIKEERVSDTEGKMQMPSLFDVLEDTSEYIRGVEATVEAVHMS